MCYQHALPVEVYGTWLFYLDFRNNSVAKCAVKQICAQNQAVE